MIQDMVMMDETALWRSLRRLHTAGDMAPLLTAGDGYRLGDGRDHGGTDYNHLAAIAATGISYDRCDTCDWLRKTARLRYISRRHSDQLGAYDAATAGPGDWRLAQYYDTDTRRSMKRKEEKAR
jgi:hypothetical protein